MLLALDDELLTADETELDATATLLEERLLVIDELATEVLLTTDDALLETTVPVDDVDVDEDEPVEAQAASVPQSHTMLSIAIGKLAVGCGSMLAIMNNCDMDCRALIPRIAEIGIVACAQSPLRTKP